MAERKVDALILPFDKFRKGQRSAHRINNFLDYAEPILGDKGFVRNQGTFAFVTCSPFDTMLFPTGHSLEKDERYDWEEQQDGSKRGYLKPDPDVTPELPVHAE